MASVATPNQCRTIIKNMSDIILTTDSLPTQKKIVEQKKLKFLDLALNKIYLCHATQYFPVNAVILARGMADLNNIKGRVTQIAEFLPEQVLYTVEDILVKKSSILRSTVHFCMNAIVETHADYVEDNQGSFIIVDPFLNGSSQIIGGLPEDIFTFGSYHISKEAVIFVPWEKKGNQEIQEQIFTLPPEVQVIYYQDDIRMVLENWLKSKGTQRFVNIDPNCDAENWFYQFGPQGYVSAEKILQAAQKVICIHAGTPMESIEELLFEIPDEKGLKETKNQLNEYKIVIEKVFRLNFHQQSLLNIYFKSLSILLDPKINFAPPKKLIENFKIEEDLITRYDSNVDYKREIPGQMVVQYFSQITKLPFKAYWRSHCSTIVDAALLYKPSYSYPNSAFMMNNALTLLKGYFDIDFVVEQYKDQKYIVLKGINLAETAEKIYTIFNSKHVTH